MKPPHPKKSQKRIKRPSRPIKGPFHDLKATFARYAPLALSGHPAGQDSFSGRAPSQGQAKSPPLRGGGLAPGFAIAPSRLAERGETRPSGGPPHPSRKAPPTPALPPREGKGFGMEVSILHSFINEPGFVFRYYKNSLNTDRPSSTTSKVPRAK